MTQSKKILLTSSVLFSFIDRLAPKHSQAEAFMRYFAQEQYHVLVASVTIVETYKLLKENISYSLAKDFLRTIFLGSIEVIYPDEILTKTAIRLVLSNSGQDLDFDQALINVMADKNQIHAIASFEYSNFYFGIQPFSLPY